MRIENISLRLNLVSNNSRGHQKRTKKLKERKRERVKEKEELKNHCKCSHEELRRKKNGEKKANKKEN